MKSQEMEWLLKDKYNGEKSVAFFADCKRLVLGEPLAYLIGWVSFLDCKIWLDSRPLIPRPETEFWAEEAIKVIKGGTTMPLGFGARSLHVLDLCAGSGCIGAAVAKAIPEAYVDFSEIDEHHLTTIKKNIQENNIKKERSVVAHADLFNESTNTYDFILSNPPYIDEALERTEKSVKEYEPYVALFGGTEGMEIITKIIEQVPRHLNHGGQLWIEHEPEQSEAINSLSGYHSFSTTTHKDQYGVERYSILVLQ
jgi:release factor glutamine methyltransferase